MNHTEWNAPFDDVEMQRHERQIYEAYAAYKSACLANPELATKKCKKELVEQVVRGISRDLQQAVVLIGTAERRWDSPAFDEVARDVFTDHLPIHMFAAWYKLEADQKHPRHFPGWVQEHFGRDQVRKVLNMIVMAAPDESRAYSAAACDLIRRAETSNDVDSWRRIWSAVSPSRRDAISIVFTRQLWRDLSRTAWHDRSIVLPTGLPTELDLLTRTTEQTTAPMTRPRWIDSVVPSVRHQLWQSLEDAGRAFITDSEKLGGEREQVGSLLTLVMSKLQQRQRQIEHSLRNQKHESVELRFDRYVFRTNEENRWGPDFAFVFVLNGYRQPTLARFALFQAKLMERGSVKIARTQLRDLIRTSWHSSFYITWNSTMPPRCVPAAIVDSYLRTGPGAGRTAKSPLLDWSDLGRYSDTMADLVADRFLCGELGDPITMEAGQSTSELASRLEEVAGPLTHGVFVVTATVNEGSVDAPVSFNDHDELRD